MSTFSNNESGVEGIPLKLIIVMVILAITIPATWKGLESYDRSQTENNLRSEIEFLSTHMKQVYLNGIGNAQNVDVDFKDGMMTKIEWIKIGDTVEGIWSSIRYKLSHKGDDFFLIKNPNMPVGNVSDGEIGPLKIGAGRHTIHLECREGFDFDDDGAQDMYVEVSRMV